MINDYGVLRMAGVYAPDGSLMVSIDTSLPGLYTPSGAMKVTLVPGGAGGGLGTAAYKNVGVPDGVAATGANADITSLEGTTANPGVRLRSASTSLASDVTVDIGAAPTRRVAITGTVTVTSFGTVPHAEVLLRFSGILTLTHNATSLILPGAANITTAAGDTCLATSDASGNWTVRSYQRANGQPVVGPAATDITNASASGRSVLTGTPAQGATALGLGATDTPTFAGVVATSFKTAGTAPTLFGNSRGNALSLQDTGGTPANYLSLQASTSGFGPILSVVGTDTNAPLNVYARGTSAIALRGPILVTGLASFNSPISLSTFTVATVPGAFPGYLIYVSNARKVGEAAGSGTGVAAQFSNGNWRRLSDDTVIAA